MGNLLLDKGTVFITWAGSIYEAAPLRRQDWPDLSAGQFAWLLDTGEGIDYSPRTLWGGYVISNDLSPRGRGRLTFRPTPGRPGDDEIFTFEGDGIARAFVPLRKVGPMALLDLPTASPSTGRKGKGAARG